MLSCKEGSCHDLLLCSSSDVVQSAVSSKKFQNILDPISSNQELDVLTSSKKSKPPPTPSASNNSRRRHPAKLPSLMQKRERSLEILRKISELVDSESSDDEETLVTEKQQTPKNIQLDVNNNSKSDSNILKSPLALPLADFQLNWVSPSQTSQLSRNNTTNELKAADLDSVSTSTTISNAPIEFRACKARSVTAKPTIKKLLEETNQENSAVEASPGTDKEVTIVRLPLEFPVTKMSFTDLIVFNTDEYEKSARKNREFTACEFMKSTMKSSLKIRLDGQTSKRKTVLFSEFKTVKHFTYPEERSQKFKRSCRK